MGSTEHITLSQLAQQISRAVEGAVPVGQWIVAEISEVSINRAGHCYLTLVERPDGSAKPVADMRGAIWASRYSTIHAKFFEATGGTMQQGMKLLFRGSVSFHATYGMSVTIVDVDPSYTIGEGEMIRRKTIERLTQEGVLRHQFDQNSLPIVIQRMAVVSSPQAAGYEDFHNQIHSSGYRFTTDLYEASMQGDKTSSSVALALERILSSGVQYDVVVIIRGGGAASDLRWFDDYDLCYYISQYPIAILTGIGHQKDTSVADMVAYHSFKTPTAVAAGLIDRVGKYLALLDSHLSIIVGICQHELMMQSNHTTTLAHQLRANTMQVMQQYTLQLQRVSGQVPMLATSIVQREKAQVEGLQQRVPMLGQGIVQKEKGRVDVLGGRMLAEANFVLQSSQKRLMGASQSLRVGTMQLVGAQQSRISRLGAMINTLSVGTIGMQQQRLEQLRQGMLHSASRTVEAQSPKLEFLQMTFLRTAQGVIQQQQAKLGMLTQSVQGNDPRRILQLGYSITTDQEGRVLKSGKQLSAGQKLRVEFADSVAVTEVQGVEAKG